MTAPAYDKLVSLTLREQVRLRPNMWCGNVESDEPNGAKYHLIKEIVGNALDEALAGYGTTIEVELSPDGTEVKVTDKGRGIPHGMSPTTNTTYVEAAFSEGATGGKYDKDGEDSPYKTAVGLHGYGSKITNFLSQKLAVHSMRDNVMISIYFAEGKKVNHMASTALKLTGDASHLLPRPDDLPKP